MPVTLRDATPADVPQVLRLVRGLAAYERLLHTAVATEADMHAALFGPDRLAFAVLAGDPPVGLALCYYTLSTFTGRRDLFLEDLFVEPDHRGKGHGIALLRHLAQRAVAENCRRMVWRVLNWNEPSIRFYASIGATRVDEWHERTLSGAALKALAEGASHG
jgi:GNAT superfamily N-acetyltransferase